MLGSGLRDQGLVFTAQGLRVHRRLRVGHRLSGRSLVGCRRPGLGTAFRVVVLRQTVLPGRHPRFLPRESRCPHVCQIGCILLERHDGPLAEFFSRVLNRTVQLSIQEQLLRCTEKQFQGGLVFKAHRLLYHSTLRKE